MKIDSLEALMTEELKDIYDAEKQITRALPKLVKTVESDDLKDALQEHLNVTKNQVQRLEQVFEMLGQTAKGRHCPGMKGLLEEGEEVAKREAENGLGDAGIIGAAQKVEHYEIAAYGTLRTFAQMLGRDEVAQLFEETLEEEKEADQKLTQISEDLLRRTAGANGDEDIDEEDEDDDIEEEDELDEEDEDGEELGEEEDLEEESEESEERTPRKTPQPVAGRAQRPAARKK